MAIFTLLGSFLLLILGAFYLKKLWLGAGMSIAFFVSSKTIISADFNMFINPSIDGLLITVELALLLLGAVLFYKVMQSNNHFNTLNEILSLFSSKFSVIIILCFFFGSFMEGITGFGIPAMLIAPMLLSLGYKPFTCIILPLAATTTAVTFGALGTPLKIGLAVFAPNSIVTNTLLLNVLPVFLLPAFLAYLYQITEQTKLNWQDNRKMIWGAGLIYASIFVVVGMFSIEYVSVVAGVLGLIIYTFYLVPKDESPPILLWIKTFYPYFTLIVLLLVSKVFLSEMGWSINQNTKTISLYQPGAIFIITSFIYHLYISNNKKNYFSYFKHVKNTISIVSIPIITILLLVGYSQFIKTEIAILTQSTTFNLNNIALLFFSPLLGSLGSFLSGSATMSNLIFINLIQSTTLSIINLPLFTAMLHTGSAVGNAISLQNIVMVKSVVNDSSLNYSKIMKVNSILVGLYLIIVCIISFILLK